MLHWSLGICGVHHDINILSYKSVCNQEFHSEKCKASDSITLSAFLQQQTALTGEKSLIKKNTDLLLPMIFFFTNVTRV